MQSPFGRCALLTLLATIGCRPSAGSLGADSGVLPHPLEAREAPAIRDLPVPIARFSANSGPLGSILGGWGTPPTRFAIAAWHQDPRGFEVNRLSVVDLVGDSAIVRSTGASQEDAHWSEGRIFLDGARTLILGEIEDEYSLGLRALDVDSLGRLTDLKLPWIALPDSEATMGPSASALAAASVSVGNGRWAITFDQDLIVDPGSTEQHLLCRIDRGQPIMLVEAHGKWEISNAKRQSAGDPMGPLRSCDGH